MHSSRVFANTNEMVDRQAKDLSGTAENSVGSDLKGRKALAEERHWQAIQRIEYLVVTSAPKS
jgi:hypothetical protein